MVQVAKVAAGLNFPAMAVDARALVRTMKMVEGCIVVVDGGCKGLKFES